LLPHYRDVLKPNGYSEKGAAQLAAAPDAQPFIAPALKRLLLRNLRGHVCCRMEAARR
jgi:hypothetical protein